MTDDDKKDDKKVDEPVVEETPAEAPAPAVEEPSDATAPVSDATAPAGSDQQGRQLYDVKCADCGKDAQVPFRPSGDRPVYCRDCYMKRRGPGR